MGNFFDNLGKALGGIFFGLLLFLGSFIVVFQNEGRTNYREIAETAIPIEQATKPDDFVYVTDKVLSNEQISDGEFIRDGNFIFLGRKVEMFAWDEKEETTTDKATGEESKKYTYSRVWTASPEESGTFHDTTYVNPALGLSAKDVKVSEAKIGSYGIAMNQIGLAPTRSVPLTSESLAPTATGALMDNFIYIGSGSLLSPQVGDVRVSFQALMSGTKVTAFGKKSGDMLLAHHGKNEGDIYRMFQGDLNDAYAVLQGEYSFALWMWRAIGFFMMWIGIMTVLKPVMMLFDLVPVLGKFTNSALTFVSFLISLIVTTIVSLVSIVLHNIFVLIGIGLLSLVATYFIFFKKNPHTGESTKDNMPSTKTPKEGPKA